MGGFGATALIAVTKLGHAPGSPRTWSTYIARGEVSPTSIHARFGDLGRVDMRFRDSGPVRYSRRGRGCRGPDRYAIHSGVYVGTVRFRGEGGYTSVDAHRVVGEATTPASLDCRHPPHLREKSATASASAGGRLRSTRLIAGLRSGPSALYFSGFRRGGRSHYIAVVEKSEGKLAYYRGASVVAPSLSFDFDSALTFASVTPPAPFSGSGAFGHGPDGAKSWTGSLAVSFPGEPQVPLTGPDFKVTLSRSF